MYGQWLDSAKDVFVPTVVNINTGKRRIMLPKSVRYMGQMYVGDDDSCGVASQRFAVPSPCSNASYMALGLPFCTFISTWRLN